MISQPSAIVIATVIGNYNCTNDSVAITVSAIGGTGVLSGNIGTYFIPIGNLEIIVSDANNCADTAMVFNPSLPTVSVTANATTTIICSNATTNLFPTLQNTNSAFSYNWMPGNITDSSTIVSPIVTTTYTVIATNGACTFTSSITISSTANGSDLAQSLSLLSTAGTSCDTAMQSDGLTVSYHDSNCNLVATVNDANGGNELGNVATCVTVDANVQTVNGQPYVARHYNITPANNGPAIITLYFTQDDFNDYNLHPNIVNNTYPAFPTSGNNADPNIANIRVAKYAGSTGLGSSSVDEIIPTSVTFANGKWSVTFSVTGFSSFYLHGVNANNAPLFINTIELQASTINHQIQLNWQVLQQTNSQYFIIEKANSNLIFEKMETINSSSFVSKSNNKLNYQFIDIFTNVGKQYYKITQVDHDGKIQYSNIASSIILDNNNYTIYPNPVINIATIATNTIMPETIQILLIDVTGKVVLTNKTKLQKGTNTIEIPMQNIASGTYTMRIINAKGFVNNTMLQKQ
jgi:hypothetical protein